MTNSPYLRMLHNRVDLRAIPFTERGSRLMLFCQDSQFHIKLAERWTAWESEFGHYRRRAPFVQAMSLVDGAGLRLAVELEWDAHAVEAKTRIGIFRWVFHDEESLYLQLPRERCGLRFWVSAARGRADRRGGEFKGDSAHHETHRNLAYTTNARIVQNEIVSLETGGQQVSLLVEAGEDRAIVLNITPRLGFNRSVPPAAPVLSRAEGRWHAWFDAAPKVAAEYREQYYYAWWCMGAGLLSPRFFLTRENMVPSKTWYVGMWQWDAFFHALAYRHTDLKLAQNHLRIVLDHQRADGMLPDAVYDEGIIYEFALPNGGPLQEVTKPPLIAWAALKLYEKSGDLDFLQEVYGPITRWHAWWLEQNDDDRDGIVQYNHPYCGADDSPLWDQGMPVESPDINTYLVMQADALACIAELIGEADAAPMWRQRAEELTRKIIEHFWDDEAGLFWAMKDHQPIRVQTLFNLYPLLTGRLPKRMVERLIQHLTAPDEFWTAYPLPTVSRSDPKFDADQMWRGPSWVNVNYLFIEGLAKCGYADLARILRDRTLDVVRLHPDIYEYYNPLTGYHPPKSAGMFGWTSAVYIDLALQASRDAAP
jgi:glycogen debranching enzyme